MVFLAFNNLNNGTYNAFAAESIDCNAQGIRNRAANLAICFSVVNRFLKHQKLPLDLVHLVPTNFFAFVIEYFNAFSGLSLGKL